MRIPVVSGLLVPNTESMHHLVLNHRLEIACFEDSVSREVAGETLGFHRNVLGRFSDLAHGRCPDT